MVTVDCVEFCKALADETRQRILEMLTEGEMSVFFFTAIHRHIQIHIWDRVEQALELLIKEE